MLAKTLIHYLIPVEFQPPKNLPTRILASLGYYRFRTRLAAHGDPVPDIGLYRPLYSPWEGEEPFRKIYEQIRPHTLVSADRCYILWKTLQQAMQLQGELMECGVFRGGTALLEAKALSEKPDGRNLHLFDSFIGMPKTTKGLDRFLPTDLNTTSLERVSRLLADYPFVKIHAGFIPQTFADRDIPRVAWAHVDVDIYQSVKDCIAYIYPRLLPSGIMVFDDYGFPSCAGARRAVDEAFGEYPETPICLPTGQCLLIKLPPNSSR
jgi:O-methyltransferase